MLRRFGIRDSYSRAFNVFVLLFALIGCWQIIIWFDRTLPVEVRLRVIKIEDLIVRPGGVFQYENVFVRNKFCETHVDRWFVGSDDIIRNIDPLPSAMPTEGLNQRQSSIARIAVPRDMPPGLSKSCFQSTWICNPLQRAWPLKGPETCLGFQVERAPQPLSLWFDPPAPPVTRVVEGEW